MPELTCIGIALYKNYGSEHPVGSQTERDRGGPKLAIEQTSARAYRGRLQERYLLPKTSYYHLQQRNTLTIQQLCSEQKYLSVELIS